MKNRVICRKTAVKDHSPHDKGHVIISLNVEVEAEEASAMMSWIAIEKCERERTFHENSTKKVTKKIALRFSMVKIVSSFSKMTR